MSRSHVGSWPNCDMPAGVREVRSVGVQRTSLLAVSSFIFDPLRNSSESAALPLFVC